ncbi:DUF502 domain-containing protein [Aliarcobacter skirrowii]|uniref:DUF502 domain-containing protein n=1 Tax=Aliarcobacter skirrowii TaxID=28200 RepID=UPI0029A8F173|nr:DUF502 domain-containing protein [Aliarcobacter skirrowii]MDX4035277.1 DUF502 domain-containing protein [Aliarcobacter skirrowii]
MIKRKLKHFFEIVLQGLFWVLPVALITIVVFWLFGKIDFLVNSVLDFVGVNSDSNPIFWFFVVCFVFVFLLYIVGQFIETRALSFTEKFLNKIPGYSTIKDIVGIFNSSKKGETKVLVVAIRGFGNDSYNIGLMYSQKQSIIKDHYTVTLSQTPIPNGGYMFEVHQDNIFVIEEATFDHNLQYLLSMGVKSLADILKIEPKRIEDLKSLKDWLKKD